MERKRYINPSTTVVVVDMGSLMDAYVSNVEGGPGNGGTGSGGDSGDSGMNGAKQNSFTNFWSDSEEYEE